MGVKALRATPNTDSTILRRALVAVVTVAALILGLIAMHSMSVTSSAIGSQTAESQPHAHHNDSPVIAHSAETVSLVSENVTPASAGTGTGTGTAILAPSCDGVCEMRCLLVSLVCALSILAAIVGLLLVKRPALPKFSIAAMVRITRVAAQHITLLQAPSLHILSISRT